MQLFWTVFAAYCFGWVVMNLLAAGIVNRALGNTPGAKKNRLEMADRISDRLLEHYGKVAEQIKRDEESKG